jgi:predicted heme/steroid binding protein
MRRWPLLLLMLLVAVSPAAATEEYAGRTGKGCDACHLDPSGGTALTAEGLAFRGSLVAGGEARRLTPALSVLRLILRFFHIIVAFLWFGTIIYVHLFLRPAYASGGLPRGELRIGWASIPGIALTGTALTLLKVPSWGFFTASRYGLVLLLKILLFVFLLLSAAVVTRVIGPRLKAARRSCPATDETGATTLEGLAAFDGKEGRSARFAFDGKVYDVTASRLWKEGTHARRHRSGTDLTGVLSQAPHGAEVLARVPLVGEMAAGKARLPAAVRVFHIMATINLTVVFVVLLLLAVWRW